MPAWKNQLVEKLQEQGGVPFHAKQPRLTFSGIKDTLDTCSIILLLHVVRELQLTEKKKKKKKTMKSKKGDGSFYTTAHLCSQARLALDTVQSPFFIGGVFHRFLHLFWSDTSFPLYYGIQTITTIPT